LGDLNLLKKIFLKNPKLSVICVGSFEISDGLSRMQKVKFYGMELDNAMKVKDKIDLIIDENCEEFI
jgi:hypothetical protein